MSLYGGLNDVLVTIVSDIDTVIILSQVSKSFNTSILSHRKRPLGGSKNPRDFLSSSCAEVVDKMRIKFSIQSKCHNLSELIEAYDRKYVTIRGSKFKHPNQLIDEAVKTGSLPEINSAMEKKGTIRPLTITIASAHNNENILEEYSKDMNNNSVKLAMAKGYIESNNNEKLSKLLFENKFEYRFCIEFIQLCSPEIIKKDNVTMFDMMVKLATSTLPSITSSSIIKNFWPDAFKTRSRQILENLIATLVRNRDHIEYIEQISAISLSILKEQLLVKNSPDDHLNFVGNVIDNAYFINSKDVISFLEERDVKFSTNLILHSLDITDIQYFEAIIKQVTLHHDYGKIRYVSDYFFDNIPRGGLPLTGKHLGILVKYRILELDERDNQKEITASIFDSDHMIYLPCLKSCTITERIIVLYLMECAIISNIPDVIEKYMDYTFDGEYFSKIDSCDWNSFLRLALQSGSRKTLKVILPKVGLDHLHGIRDYPESHGKYFDLDLMRLVNEEINLRNK